MNSSLRAILIFACVLISCVSQYGRRINKKDRHGKKHGKWEYYFRDSIIVSAGKYRHGVQVGTWTEYDLDGPILTKAKFSKRGTLKEFAAFSKRTKSEIFYLNYYKDTFDFNVVDTLAYRVDFLLASEKSKDIQKEFDPAAVFDKFCMHCHRSNIHLHGKMNLVDIDSKFMFDSFAKFMSRTEHAESQHDLALKLAPDQKASVFWSVYFDFRYYSESDKKELYEFLSRKK